MSKGVMEKKQQRKANKPITMLPEVKLGKISKQRLQTLSLNARSPSTVVIHWYWNVELLLGISIDNEKTTQKKLLCKYT